MAEVVMPQLPGGPMDKSNNRDVPDRPALGMSGIGITSPNETFVFPAPSQSPEVSYSRHQRASSNMAASSHRRKPSNLSLNALPPFEFGGSLSDPSTRPLPSPTRSPARLTPPAIHMTSHRRGGSEFVGGDITHGGPVLVSTSLPQDEKIASAPPSPSKCPPAGRGRHSHRRSGAVSQSDVKMIMQPSNSQRADSAPQTPSIPSTHQRPPGPERSSSFPRPEKAVDRKSGTPPQTALSDAGQKRSRVGFSDNLEFVSRPLSTISSETSSSMSTVRARHSVSESVGSLASGGASSPPSHKGSNTDGISDSCGECPIAVVISDQSHSDNEAAGRQKCSKRLLSARVAPSLPTYSNDLQDDDYRLETSNRPFDEEASQASSTYPAYDSTNVAGPSIGRFEARSISDPHVPRPRTSPESKSSTRQQKVKSWAETILHRKERQSPRNAQFAAHPSYSAASLTNEPDFSLDDIDFDDDTTMIIEEPGATSSGSLRLNTDVSEDRSAVLSPVSAHASPSPMIDLDAALGSLGSPMDDPAFDDYFNKASVGKRRLHSSGETGGFTGPGMHYHRRADSAPELEAFDRSRFGLPRLGSNPAMQEAIAEEEEDADLDTKRKEEQVLGLGVNVVDSEAICEEPLKRRASNISASSDKVRNRRPALGNATSSDSVEIVEAEEEPRCSVLTKSSDESTITPTLSSDCLSHHPASAPLDSALQTPSLIYGTTPETPSAVSSADYRKTSFDVGGPRIHTASSSVTGMTLDSSRAGDVGAGSVDDVPSLTSSASTMLSGHPDRLSGSGNTFSSGDRPASYTAALPARTRPYSSSKRSSLASLSNLLGGPYNKSKLNIAETLPPDTPERKSKKKNRISRMMKFWKSKEKLSPG